jgi:hypothetical protein
MLNAGTDFSAKAGKTCNTGGAGPITGAPMQQ